VTFDMYMMAIRPDGTLLVDDRDNSQPVDQAIERNREVVL
jgi:hypothetical protein